MFFKINKKRVPIFEHLVVEHKSFNDKFAKGISGPYPKMCSFVIEFT
jgi:hypothetical protein